MQYPYLPVGAFIGAALVIIPAPWHWKARNIPTLSLMGWLYVLNIIYGVNSILWAGNVNNPSPVWCDITTKLMIGGQIALPAATFCITRSLESISAGRVVYRDSASKRRWMIFEIFVCIGFPILVMGLHYVVQGHRFDIIENFGCEPAVYFSIASVFILSFPPLFFAVLTLGFGGAAFHHFLRHRINFIEHLAHSDCALTTQRYLRLMIMALFLIVWNTSLTAYNLAVNTAPGLRKWTNWDDVHSNFSRVDLYAEFLLPPSFIRNLMLFWWAVPVSSYIVFFFFGLGEEAMKEYRKLCMWFRRCVLKKEDITFSGSLPSYNTPAPPRYPFKSFTSTASTATMSTLSSEQKKISYPSTRAPSSTATLPAYPTTPSTASSPDTPSKPMLPPLPSPTSSVHAAFPTSPSTARHSFGSIAHPRSGTPPPSSPRPFSYPAIVHARKEVRMSVISATPRAL